MSNCPNCPNCGKSSKAGDRVCAYCGFLLPSSGEAIAPGTVLQGRYRIERLLHEGDTIYTFLARDERLDRQCIVKRVKEHLKSAIDRPNLGGETTRLVSLSHPNIAMVFDYFFEDDFFFLVTEFVSGKTLREIFIEHNRRLAEEEVIKWAISICDAVVYIHKQGIVHGLISPDTVMITEDGFIKLTSPGEFSSISIRKHDRKSIRRFSAPEQRYGNPVPQSDIFSIGATMYYLLTGFVPQPDQSGHGFPPIRQKDSTISSKLEVVLEKALRLEAARRYVSAQEFGKALKEALQELKAPKLQRERLGDIKAVRSKEQIAVTMDTPSSNRAWVITLILSLMLGFLGADRFYLRQYRWGVWKLLTLGGFGWWWFADLVYFAIQRRNFSVAIRNELPHRKYSKRIAICSTVLPIVLFNVFQITIGTFKVYGSSMLPGIEQDDYIMVSKATYFFNEPQRGSIIVFHSPRDTNTDCICRIIAVPGDTVEIKDNTVFVNGAALVEPYILEAPKYIYPRQKINANHYFVLGDNRNNSNDSHRGWTVPRENIIGKVWITYWPPYRWGDLKQYDAGVGRQTAVSDKQISSPDNTVPTSSSTNILFEDDFSDANSGWHVVSPENVEWKYQDGGYRIAVKEGGRSVWSKNERIGQLDDFVFEVDARWQATPSPNSLYGIVFRMLDEDNLYRFYVMVGGWYGIDKKVGGTQSTLRYLTDSPHIQKGTATNRLKVACKGPEISVYVNNNHMPPRLILRFQRDMFR